MRILATLSQTEVTALFDQLLPVEIEFGQGERRKGSLRLDKPFTVRILAGQGVRLACRGELGWRFAFGPMSIELERIELVLVPEVARHGASWALAFRPRIVTAEFDLVPAFVERSAVDLVNEAFAEHDIAWRWHYGTALDRSFELSEVLQPIETFAMTALEGEVRVTDGRLELEVPLAFAFRRQSSAQGPPTQAGRA